MAESSYDVVLIGDLDPGAVLCRRESFAAHGQDDRQASWLQSAGLALHRGQGGSAPAGLSR